MLLDQRRYGGRAFATASVLLAFAVIYPLLYARGGAANAALCAIPVLVAGYLWGMGAGAATGLVILPLTTIELVALGVPKADLPLTFGQGGPAVVLAMLAVGAVVGRLRDLGARLLREAAARVASDRRYADLFENAHDVVFTYNLDCELTHVNRATERLLGYSREELVGMDPGILIPGDQWEKVRRMLNDCLEGRAVDGPYEIEWLTRDGRTVILEISPLLLSEDGVPVGIQGIARDVTERKRIEETLRHQALHDPLTGLPNRTLLEDRLAQEVKRAERDEAVLGVLVLDLTEFKAVNDTFGHLVGDDLLRQVGERLVGATREADTVARMGGDEFGIVLGGIRGEDDAALAGTAPAGRPRRVDPRRGAPDLGRGGHRRRALSEPWVRPGNPDAPGRRRPLRREAGRARLLLLRGRGRPVQPPPSGASGRASGRNRPKEGSSSTSSPRSTAAPGRSRASRRWSAGATRTMA